MSPAAARCMLAHNPTLREISIEIHLRAISALEFWLVPHVRITEYMNI